MLLFKSQDKVEEVGKHMKCVLELSLGANLRNWNPLSNVTIHNILFEGIGDCHLFYGREKSFNKLDYGRWQIVGLSVMHPKADAG